MVQAVAPKQSAAVQIIKTPQALVHIKHTITLRQYKYWILLLKFYREFHEQNIEPSRNGFYSFPISKLAEYLGYTLVTKEVKEDFEKLRQQPITLNYLEKDGTKVAHGLGFISEWKVTSKTISFILPSFLKDVMANDEEAKSIFQLLNWNIFNSFNGKYEAIIYKLCKDYVGVKRTPYMTVSQYREYIGLKDEEYTEFKKLNFWTISKPIDAINNNEISDISVKVNLRKEGRKVVGLWFSVQSKQGTLNLFSSDDKTVQQPRVSHAGFAGLELQLLKQIQSQHPEITERYVRDFAGGSDLDIVSALNKIKKDYTAAEQFSLEKTD